MRSRRVTRLALVNLSLLGGAAALWLLGAGASAQPAPGRGRGEYLMIASPVPGSNANLVQLLDTSTQELVTMRFDQGRRA